MPLAEAFSRPDLVLVTKNFLIQTLPVLFFAIWASMRAEDLLEIESGEDESGEKIDPLAEGRLIRVGYGLALVGQVLAYLLAESAASLPYHLGWCAFVVALFVLARIKFGMEARACRLMTSTNAKPIGTSRVGANSADTSDPGTDSLPTHTSTRALGSLVVLVLGYLLLVQASTVGFGLAGELLQLSPNAVVGLRIAGTLVGVFLALLSAFATAPFYLRKIFPCKPVTETEQLNELTACFRRANLESPDFWILEVDSFGHHNAMLAGFGGGRGWLKPSMFLTRSLFQKLSPAERQAVLLHEVSHLKLKHIRSRFLVTFGALVAATVLSGLIILGALWWLPSSVAFFLVVGAMFLPSVVPYVCARRLVTTQEGEADLFAVFELGADLDALANALRLLDRKGFSMTGHPATQNRIAALQAEALRRRRGSPRLDNAA